MHPILSDPTGLVGVVALCRVKPQEGLFQASLQAAVDTRCFAHDHGLQSPWVSAQEATPGVGDTLVLVQRDEGTETIAPGEPGASAGGILVWAPNPLYDAANETGTGETLVAECIWLTSDGHQR